MDFDLLRLLVFLTELQGGRQVLPEPTLLGCNACLIFWLWNSRSVCHLRRLSAAGFGVAEAILEGRSSKGNYGCMKWLGLYSKCSRFGRSCVSTSSCLFLEILGKGGLRGLTWSNRN